MRSYCSIYSKNNDLLRLDFAKPTPPVAAIPPPRGGPVTAPFKLMEHTSNFCVSYIGCKCIKDSKCCYTGADVDADADVDVNADVVAVVGVVVVAVVMTAEDVDAAAGCPSCALLALVNNCAIFMWISRRVHHFFTYGAFPIPFGGSVCTETNDQVWILYPCSIVWAPSIYGVIGIVHASMH